MNYKELVVSYKTIYIDTYNIKVIGLASDKQINTVFRHVSFQLWESEISGLFNPKNKDFILLN